MKKPSKIFCLMDYKAFTGFSTVSTHIKSEIKKHFREDIKLDICAINYFGEPYEEEDDDDASETMDFDDNMEDLEQLDELEDTNSETSNVNSEFVAETLDLNYEENFKSQPGEQGNTDEQVENISTSDLKKINITLEETNSESLDYKKLPLPKLRNIVAEKGLTLDTSKLKKHELLKLLGVE